MDFADTSPVALVLSLIIGYLSGSVPYGLLLTQMAGLGDVRKIGSGNIGATNVLRTGNKKLAALTVLLDGLKGTVPVALANHFLGLDAAILAGLGAFLGHLYPVWLRFKGGKGIATFAGISLGYSWHVLLPFAVVWIAMAVIFRYSSLAALVASVATTVAIFFVGLPKLGIFYIVLTILVFWKHRQNISRLLAGTESKIGSKG
ncbi:glycerol-3-phosphate 1-O-acyltransferase PlsY [Oricola sp.]|uniref:glycerol-3-phosphate 1-O-acyltransferase PlsY n=1 Tax=Oricola sp. TaxID=1979950 RepID=UPI0035166FC4